MDKMRKLAEGMGYETRGDTTVVMDETYFPISEFERAINDEKFVEVLAWLVDQDLGAATKALAMYSLRVEGLRQAVINAALAIGGE